MLYVTYNIFLEYFSTSLGCFEKKSPEAGVLVRKLSKLTPLSEAKVAYPRYLIMLCEISFELAGCLHQPIVDSSTIAG
jgi:hypothetical protein